MTEVAVHEVAPGLFKEGEEFVFDPKKVVVEGTKRGIALIGETAANRNMKFDEALIKKLHAQVLYYMPGVAGKYRLSEKVEVTGDEVVEGKKVPDRMYMFGRWLEEETEELKDRPEDLLGGLRLACEAHYGLVSPQLHPFDDGNGRVARLLANGILMMNTHELMFYGIRILPVPLIRQPAQHDKEDPYIRILKEVNHTRVLNPFEIYIAGLWVKNLSSMITSYITRTGGHTKLTEADHKLINKFKNRARTLNEFIDNPKEDHIVPDYFATHHVII